MKIVIDTNVLMAGLLKDSIVREILVTKNIEFYIPERGIAEVKKYRQELCDKAGYTKVEFETLLAQLLENVSLISQDELRPYMKRAETIMKDIDFKDSPFIAACLALKAEGIWSFDNHFKKQKEIQAFNIKEIIEFNG